MKEGKVFVRFCAVGLLATGVHYAVLFALSEGSGTLPELASSIGFILSTGLNYALNRRYTFRSRRRHQSALPRFLAVVGVGVLLNGLVLSFCFRVLGANLLGSQIFATLVVLAWNFLCNRYWVFPPDDSRDRSSRNQVAVEGRIVR